MKTILLLQLTIFFSLFFYSEVNAQTEGGCGCYISICVFNNGQPQSTYDVFHNNNGSTIDFINPGDSVCFSAHSIEECNVGFTLMRSADTIFSDGSNSSVRYTVFDTGQYYFHSFCDILFRNYTIKLLPYINTGIEHEAFTKTSELYPTASAGIFHLSTRQLINQIIISDTEGRIVKTLSSDFSEVDLTDFSPGIYLYMIKEGNGNFFRGKILKE